MCHCVIAFLQATIQKQIYLMLLVLILLKYNNCYILMHVVSTLLKGGLNYFRAFTYKTNFLLTTLKPPKRTKTPAG